MTVRDTVLISPEGASAVLGVAAGATEEEIRSAYLRKVKEHPPERDPAAFERIRDAYEVLRDPRRRARQMLLAGQSNESMTAALRACRGQRRFVGPQAWLAVLKEM